MVRDPGDPARVEPQAADFHNIFGEPDMKGAAKELRMRGSELAKAMAEVVDHLVNDHESMGGLERAIEMIVSTIGRFNGKDVTSYQRPTGLKC